MRARAQRPTLVMFCVLSAAGLQMAHADPAATPNPFEDSILAEIHQGHHREAILAVLEYEEDLLSRYRPPSFELGLFQSERDHLSFHSTFIDWEVGDDEVIEIPAWLGSMGPRLLLLLDGENSEDQFFLWFYDLDRIEQRLGVEAGDHDTRLSDRELRMAGQMVASQLGVVKAEEFRTIGDHDILLLKVETPMSGPVSIVNLGHDKQVFCFIVSSSLRTHADNEKKLLDLVKTVSFQYKPEDQVRIEAIRSRFAGRTDPASRLAAVSELAQAGEYYAAAGELAELRYWLNDRMPKPEIKGSTARFPAQGVQLVNPDEERWQLGIEEEGMMQILVLEDRRSVKNEGIGVMTVDLVLTYGLGIREIGKDLELRRQFLLDGGRGAAMNIGRAIEDEQFTELKGIMAYEAVVAMNVPGVKLKFLWTEKDGVAIGILMFADARKFEERIQEYEALLQGEWLVID